MISTLHLAFRAKRTSQSADTRFFGALRASTLDVRCPFRGCPLSSPRCISPLEQSTTMLNPRQILAFAPWEDVRFGSLAEISHCKSRCLLYPRNQARQSNVLLRAKSAKGNRAAFAMQSLPISLCLSSPTDQPGHSDRPVQFARV